VEVRVASRSETRGNTAEAAGVSGYTVAMGICMTVVGKEYVETVAGLIFDIDALA
jgi:hypothetical protein